MHTLPLPGAPSLPRSLQKKDVSKTQLENTIDSIVSSQKEEESEVEKWVPVNKPLNGGLMKYHTEFVGDSIVKENGYMERRRAEGMVPLSERGYASVGSRVELLNDTFGCNVCATVASVTTPGCRSDEVYFSNDKMVQIRLKTFKTLTNCNVDVVCGQMGSINTEESKRRYNRIGLGNVENGEDFTVYTTLTTSNVRILATGLIPFEQFVIEVASLKSHKSVLEIALDALYKSEEVCKIAYAKVLKLGLGQQPTDIESEGNAADFITQVLSKLQEFPLFSKPISLSHSAMMGRLWHLAVAAKHADGASSDDLLSDEPFKRGASSNNNYRLEEGDQTSLFQMNPYLMVDVENEQTIEMYFQSARALFGNEDDKHLASLAFMDDKWQEWEHTASGTMCDGGYEASCYNKSDEDGNADTVETNHHSMWHRCGNALSRSPLYFTVQSARVIDSAERSNQFHHRGVNYTIDENHLKGTRASGSNAMFVMYNVNHCRDARFKDTLKVFSLDVRMWLDNPGLVRKMLEEICRSGSCVPDVLLIQNTFVEPNACQSRGCYGSSELGFKEITILTGHTGEKTRKLSDLMSGIFTNVECGTSVCNFDNIDSQRIRKVQQTNELTTSERRRLADCMDVYVGNAVYLCDRSRWYTRDQHRQVVEVHKQIEENCRENFSGCRHA